MNVETPSLTIPQAGRLLGISHVGVRRAIAKGLISAYNVGIGRTAKLKISPQEIERFLAERKVNK